MSCPDDFLSKGAVPRGPQGLMGRVIAHEFAEQAESERIEHDPTYMPEYKPERWRDRNEYREQLNSATWDGDGV